MSKCKSSAAHPPLSENFKTGLAAIGLIGGAAVCCNYRNKADECERRIKSNKEKKLNQCDKLRKEIKDIDSKLNTIIALETTDIALDTTINATVTTINATVTQINQKQKATFLITAALIGTTGYTITQPGTYQLVEDVVFNPPNLGPTNMTVQVAITIKSSFVTLILGDKTISQAGWVDASTIPNYSTSRINAPSTQTPYVVGISIPDTLPTSTDINAVGLQSIYIEGDQAVVNGFSMYGIRVFGHTKDIQIRNVTIKNNGLLALLYLRPFSNYIPHSFNTVGQFGPSMGVAALAIGESTIFGMGPTFFQDVPQAVNNINRSNDIRLENVYLIDNAFIGLVMPGSSNILINNLQSLGTFSDDPGVAGTSGYQIPDTIGALFDNAVTSSFPLLLNGNVFPSIENAIIQNSMFNNTKTLGDFTTTAVGAVFPIGGVVEGFSKNVDWINCQFNDTFYNFIGGTAVGYISGSTENSNFYSCHFDGNSCIAGSINSFHRSYSNHNALNPLPSSATTSRSTIFKDCTFCNNQVNGDLQLPVPLLRNDSCEGLHLAGAKTVTMFNCVASDNALTGPNTYNQTAQTGHAVGFVINAPNNIFAPTSTEPTIDGEDIVLKQCVASRNRTFNGGIAVGFSPVSIISASFWSLRSFLLEDCEAFGNNALVPTSTLTGVVQGFAAGFYIQQNFQTQFETQQSFPGSLIRCKAYRNFGIPIMKDSNGNVLGFSAGIFLQNAINHSIRESQTLNNDFGIVLQNCIKCDISENQSDSNADGTGVGNGFMDLGPTPTALITSLPFSVTNATNATPIVITVSPVAGVATPPSGSLVTVSGVLGNTAANGTFYMITTGLPAGQFSLDNSSGNGTYTGGGSVQAASINVPVINATYSATGPIVITLALAVSPPTGSTVTITGILPSTNPANGTFTVTQISTTTFSLNGTTGMIGTYVVPTPTTIQKSLSTWQSNHAYNNGNGTTHFGANGNYDVDVTGTGVSPQLFQFQQSNPVVSLTNYAFVNPAVNTPVANISSIQ